MNLLKLNCFHIPHTPHFIHLTFTLQQPVWYHRQFQRVTSIEDCDVSDMTCRSDLKKHFHKSNFNVILQLRFEANQQFLRDWMVEAEMLGLLRLVHMVFLLHMIFWDQIPK